MKEIDEINKQIKELQRKRSSILRSREDFYFDFNKSFIDIVQESYPDYSEMLASNLIPVKLKKKIICKFYFKKNEGQKSNAKIFSELSSLLGLSTVTIWRTINTNEK